MAAPATAAPGSPPRLEPRLFAVGCVIAGLAFQGSRGLFETDEGRYAECARAMAVSGDWLVPRLQELPHLTKPPGAYWLVAAGIETFGRNAWGARVLLGVAFALAAWCVRVIGRGLLGEPAGARAGWCYLTMLYPFAAGGVLTTDTFLSAAVLGAIACSVTSLRAERPWRWHLAATVCVAAAMQIKGHAALLPWGAFLAGWLWSRGRLAPERKVLAWWCVPTAIVLGSAWYVWAAIEVPGAYEHFTGHELVGRFVSTSDHSAKPLWFYPAVILAGTLPWWLPIVRGVGRLRLDPAGRVLAGWGGITFLVFLALPGKMVLYLLPCAAPLAVWAAAGTKDAVSPWPVRPRLLATWGALLLALKCSAAFLDDRRDMRRLAELVREAGAGSDPPVTLLAGRDLHGLDFYLDGAVRRVLTSEVRTSRSRIFLATEVAARAEAGRPWLLLAEDEGPEWAGIRRVLGDSAEVVARPKSYVLLRIVPKRP